LGWKVLELQAQVKSLKALSRAPKAARIVLDCQTANDPPRSIPLPNYRMIPHNSRPTFMRTLSPVFAVALVVACEKVPTRDPLDLARVFHPIFARELLAASQLPGLVVNLQNPVKAGVFIKVNSSTSATDLARNSHDEPLQWLRLPDSQLLLYSQPPDVQSHDSSNIELR
jgi:hypothetical protein